MTLELTLSVVLELFYTIPWLRLRDADRLKKSPSIAGESPCPTE